MTDQTVRCPKCKMKMRPEEICDNLMECPWDDRCGLTSVSVVTKPHKEWPKKRYFPEPLEVIVMNAKSTYQLPSKYFNVKGR